MKGIGNSCYALIFAGVLLLPGCGKAQPEPGSQQAAATAAMPASTPITDVDPPRPPQVGIGTYVTEGGWGRLIIDAPKGQELSKFSLDTENVDSGCTLSGQLDKSGHAVVYEGAEASQCSLVLKMEANGVAISTSTKEQCQAYCGSNGSFEGIYKRLSSSCATDAIEKARHDFKSFYDKKKYVEAKGVLAPIYQSCVPTMSLADEGALRNDYALTLYKLKDKPGCLSALSKYKQDAARTDDQISEGMAPAVVDEYLTVIHAARTNIALCSR
ncbi:hypothetical protein M3O57_20280 [Xanthomonas nasturtii]|uniref:hypothetical protein n=1 Tax=Xanthomonas nasturtii TaxID=1843581 RepID=UPI0011C063BA|nr:hypothetical protein [Xanthomonas nasturtii]MCL1501547.1 hypothetical protein [Xanthomonas nasturtii]MCL1505459.1 hypothetical protein [Xanthomonas nasturtii]MCL1524968.1 hypothetical protein [Xanthomonas nasturtii]MCL1532651.1 hypothetical protein [Xanthomonas nasturtii]MCL1561843.1 hypothetical protein [Xanthomonas nasturtii]